MGLLDLPVELRNRIYESFLDDLVSPPWHPWEALPTHQRFTEYLALLLTNRQVYDECHALFQKHYSHRLVYFFDNIWDLLDFRTAHASDPMRENAQFVMRNKNVPDDAFKRSALAFTMGQPGFDQRWVLLPGFYVTNPQPHPRQYHRFASDNVASGVREGTYWDPQDHGFQRIVGDHSRCYPVDKERCKPYVRLVYPSLDNGCRINCYSWGQTSYQSPTLFYGNDWPACMVMEGRLRFFDIPSRLGLDDEAERTTRRQQRASEDATSPLFDVMMGSSTGAPSSSGS